MIDDLVALRRLLPHGGKRDDHVIGVELAKCIVDRRRTEFVATRPRSRDTQAGELVENDSEALIGRRSCRIDAPGQPLDRADEARAHHPDLGCRFDQVANTDGDLGFSLDGNGRCDQQLHPSKSSWPATVPGSGRPGT